MGVNAQIEPPPPLSVPTDDPPPSTGSETPALVFTLTGPAAPVAVGDTFTVTGQVDNLSAYPLTSRQLDVPPHTAVHQTQNFDVENRLTSVVKSGGGTTTFVYDADGQRMKTVEPSGKTIYYPFPGFEVEVNGPVTMKRVTYSLGGPSAGSGSAIAQRELGLGLAENYDDGNAAGWTAHSGSWSMLDTGAGYAYRQTNTANTATNSSYALTQSGGMAYEWQATFNSGITAGGLHFMASTAADANHGNSYLVWQNSSSILIYESVSNTLNQRASAGLVAANGQTYQYRVTYNAGVITVWRNGAQVLSWTDSTPLTSGSYVAWRTNQSNVSFDNLRVTGSPASYNTLVYLHGDHLGSIGAVTNSSGALLDMTRFLPLRQAQGKPFGGFRGSDPAFLTERAFTGHKANNTSSNDLGLIYMNARHYVSSIGRFASADTLVPDQIDPQALNRYAYARNNPLLIVDPSGHCWGFAGFLRNTFYSTTCNNLDMAVSIVQHPDASVGQKVAAGAYIVGEAAAHTVAVTGSVVAGVGCLTGAGTAICAAGGTAVTAVSADGDPTNEVQGVARSLCGDGDCTNEIRVGSNALQEGASQGYRSFQAFKNAQGAAGEGQAWHHIVNQNASNVARFGAERIHNTNNLIKLPDRAGEIHRQITGYYNSIRPDVTGSSTLRIREWLELQSFELQYQFGIDTIIQFGGQQYISLTN